MSSNQTPTTSDKHILLIDDQGIFIKSISSILKDWGYQVDTSTSPLEALTIFKERTYFLVICDLYMESFSGYKLLYRFGQERPEQICCLMTSAENDEPLLRKTLRLANVKGLIKKPVCFEQLKKLLEDVPSLVPQNN